MQGKIHTTFLTALIAANLSLVSAEAPPKGKKKPYKNPVATLEFEEGKIEIELFPKLVPNTVANFVELATNGYYDQTFVYKIVPGLAVQLGAKDKQGKQQPKFTIDDEFHKDLKHDEKGKVSMSSPGPDMNSAQFLITLVPTPHFDEKYSQFGVVTTGMELIEGWVEESQTEKKQDHQIKKVTIQLNDYVQQKVKKRTPFSSDDIEKMTSGKARKLLKSIAATEGLGKMDKLKLTYKSVRGRKAQVAYEATFENQLKTKIILLGRISDNDLELKQFQYQQIVSKKKQVAKNKKKK